MLLKEYLRSSAAHLRHGVWMTHTVRRTCIVGLYGVSVCAVLTEKTAPLLYVKIEEE